MFNKTECQKGSFLEQTKAAREERAFEKKKEVAVKVIQAQVRGWLARKKFSKQILYTIQYLIYMQQLNYYFNFSEQFDALVLEDCDHIPATQIYHNVCRLLIIWQQDRDKDRFARLCRYLVTSLESESPKISYVGVSLNKQFAVTWISHMKNILWKCCVYLKKLKPEFANDMKLILLFLHTLVSYTATNTWAILKSKSFEMLKPGMNQLCANIMGYLLHRGFYITLQVRFQYFYNFNLCINFF